MAVDVSSVRSELQIPTGVISDSDITYAITKVSSTDLNLVCAEVLRMVLRKYRGRKSLTIGKFSETYNLVGLRGEIHNYMAKSTSLETDDGVAFTDSRFPDGADPSDDREQI